MSTYSGQFVNRYGEKITVTIAVGTDGVTHTIGSDSEGLWFTDDPVEITSEMNDCFDHLLCHSAVIRIETRQFIPELFSRGFRDTSVTIMRGSECLFAGFLEPQTYSQPYNDATDVLELNCIDAISALQYANYANVGQPVNYADAKASAVFRTFGDIIGDIIAGISSGVQGANILFDGSRSLTQGGEDIFIGISVSELLFFGDSEDDMWTQKQVLEEILKYLNLHITQSGRDFFIFSWQTIKDGGRVSWRSLSGSSKTTDSSDIILSSSNVEDTGTQISIGEVYNKLVLTCDVKPVEDVVENPLNEDLLSPAFPSRDHYIREYSADGEGMGAKMAFMSLFGNVSFDDSDYDEKYYTRDWYIQVMKNGLWQFRGIPGTVSSQADVLRNLRQNPGAAIVAFGNVEKEGGPAKDNSPVASLSMTNCLVISVNGNGVTKGSSSVPAYPLPSDILQNIPYATYNGNVTAGFTPSDEDTTNYIVISGKIILNPIYNMSGSYDTLKNINNPMQLNSNMTVPSRNNGDGRYYTVDFNGQDGLMPYTGDGPRNFEYKTGSNGDTISKIPVLRCMLIIGDKCVVENASSASYSWKIYKTREQCSSDEEYYRQSFTIGFDPKSGDYLVGTEFSVQNDHDYTKNIDVEGMSIPIRKSDAVSGSVRFMILGPESYLYDNVKYIHVPIWNEDVSVSSYEFLMAAVSSIIVKNFEMKIVSDNAMVTDNSSNSDLVYMSDEDKGFVNCKDDIEFKMNSDLTTSERNSLNWKAGVSISTPMVGANGLTKIWDNDTKQNGKPEKLYLDAYYRECSTAKLLMDQNMQDRVGNVSLFNRYTHPALPGMTFYVQGISRNLIEGSARLKLKQI